MAPVRSDTRRGQQHQLVQRQGPGVAGGDREGDAADGTGVDLLEQVLEGETVGRAAKGESAGHRLDRLGPGRDQQRVVGQLLAGARYEHAPLRVHADHRVDAQLGVVVTRDLCKVEARRLAEAERLDHGQGPVGELRLGRDERQVDVPPAEPAKGDQALERREPAARDHDARAHVTHPGGRRGPARR